MRERYFAFETSMISAQRERLREKQKQLGIYRPMTTQEKCRKGEAICITAVAVGADERPKLPPVLTNCQTVPNIGKLPFKIETTEKKKKQGKNRRRDELPSYLLRKQKPNIAAGMRSEKTIERCESDGLVAQAINSDKNQKQRRRGPATHLPDKAQHSTIRTTKTQEASDGEKEIIKNSDNGRANAVESTNLTGPSACRNTTDSLGPSAGSNKTTENSANEEQLPVETTTEREAVPQGSLESAIRTKSNSCDVKGTVFAPSNTGDEHGREQERHVVVSKRTRSSMSDYQSAKPNSLVSGIRAQSARATLT
ncbi:predicted protein [Nematostella vectensis]|uniref:Uncharacterized protein n=1 Tax=Nematostella vectensis TaxID=45351 RepID=A7T8Q8_NEMVE|nr:predicted protein [Nematostella vectensis]|eukprot:XP_001619727.1 hypothetical protein NEMVEDRAFT_v1g248833 [Nematostella vectensis]